MPSSRRSRRVRAQPLKLGAALQPPLGFVGVRLSPALRVYCSKAAWVKHRRAIVYLGRQGCLIANPAGATHRVLAGKAARESIEKDIRAGGRSMSELLHELRTPVERAIA